MSGAMQDRNEMVKFTGNSLLEQMIAIAIDIEMNMDVVPSKYLRAARVAISIMRQHGDSSTLGKMLDEVMNIEPTPRKVAPMQQQKQHHGGNR